MIRVLVADDHAVVREGIKRIITDAPDMTVAGEAADGQELLAMVMREDWDVVLMDLAMPGPSALETLGEIRRVRPRLPVLVLSIYPEDQYAVRTLMAGASGYISKECRPEELLQALRTVLARRRYVSAAVAERLAAHVDRTAEKPRHEALSNREFEVLCLIASGKSIGDIARQLMLSVKTVSTFRSRILEKLGLRHNAEIIRYALQHRLAE